MPRRGVHLRHRPPRTKIVATLGPASESPSRIRALLRAGVDVFRLNLSHGTHEGHARIIAAIRTAVRSEGRPAAILADLQGPKIRIGQTQGETPLFLRRGDELSIVCRRDFVGGDGRVGCTYLDLCRDVRPGDRLLIDDGSIELRVTRVDGDTVVTRVRYGGLLRPHKGINLPGTAVRAPSLTRKDLADLRFALEHEVDFVALSFVRRAADITDLKRRIASAGSAAEVVAKIERPEALDHFEAILAAADGVMVARGDLGVEIGPEAVPGVQKRLIARCIAAGKPVITATQMLESMVENPRPTRAEASDVANAVFDGSSALMLSAETAAGGYPLRAVRTMGRIIRATEKILFRREGHPARRRLDRAREGRASVEEAVVASAARAAAMVAARAVVAFTETGRTARLLARERIPQRLFAFTPEPATLRRLCLQWGVEPLPARRERSVDRLLDQAERRLLTEHFVAPGDRIVFISGIVQVAGATNSLRIRTAGETPPR